METRQGSPIARELLTPAEVMSRLKVNRRWLERRVELGELRPFKLGRLNRFDAEEITAFLERGRGR